MFAHAENSTYRAEQRSDKAVECKQVPSYIVELQNIGKTQNLPDRQISRKERNKSFIGDLGKYPRNRPRDNSYEHSLDKERKFYKRIGSTHAFHYAYFLAAGKDACSCRVINYDNAYYNQSYQHCARDNRKGSS